MYLFLRLIYLYLTLMYLYLCPMYRHLGPMYLSGRPKALLGSKSCPGIALRAGGLPEGLKPRKKDLTFLTCSLTGLGRRHR